MERPPAAGRLLPRVTASYGGHAGPGRLNETIITYLGNLSIYNYKWFTCCGIEESKVETRNLKVETRSPRKSNPAPFSTPTPNSASTRSFAALNTPPPPHPHTSLALHFP